ncbi:hypothetical protein [Helicobacter bizzozeronii]|uniref:hypothetical protein n=1 Tax=Helicobacter bizzozeronii TaxID=56877 RepID=UPI001F1CC645|nr:hypothetical protein [Helicobacter bizzozeronii]
MLKFFFFVLLALLPCWADPSAEKAKVIYLKALNAQELSSKPVYVGQTISITYDLLLFSQAKFLGAELLKLPNPKQLKRLNFAPQWKSLGNDNFSATYQYKVMGLHAEIPALKVSAFSQEQGFVDTSSVPSIPLQVVDLSQNPNYIGVVARDFQVVSHKVKEYDSQNNILVFEIKAQEANLEDLKIPVETKQGFESSHFGIGESHGIYYCILPKSMRQLSFSYFALTQEQFKPVQFSLIPIVETISTQSNLKPKNNLFLFSNFVLGFLLLFVAVLYFVTRYKNTSLVVALLLVGALLWNIFSGYKSAVLLPHTEIKILPTDNSTILTITTHSIPVKIIGSHAQYDKILTQDERIGWVKKTNVE